MILRRAFLGWTTGALAVGASGATSAASADNKVVYHLSERERIMFVLGNIQNR